MKETIIQSTTKYDQFKSIESNRSILPAHVEKLKKAIMRKNLLHLNPIIVDAKKNIIDGQHRIAAAKALKLPIFFMVDTGISESDIAELNTNKSNWSLKNYIDYWSKKGNKHYKLLLKFINEFPGINLHLAAELLIIRNRYSGLTDVIKSGNYELNNYEAATDLMAKVNDFKDFKYRNDRSFIRALKHCIETGEYDHMRMQDKLLQIPPGMLIRCANHQQYVEMIEKIYNYKTSLNFVSFKLTKVQRDKLKQREQEKLQKEIKANAKHSNNTSKQKKITEATLNARKSPPP